MGTLDGMRDDCMQALQRAHTTFCNDPSEDNAWVLAARAESLLDVLKEMP